LAKFKPLKKKLTLREKIAVQYGSNLLPLQNKDVQILYPELVSRTKTVTKSTTNKANFSNFSDLFLNKNFCKTQESSEGSGLFCCLETSISEFSNTESISTSKKPILTNFSSLISTLYSSNSLKSQSIPLLERTGYMLGELKSKV
jgi:hypothetical protein